MMETCKIENLYDLKETIAAELLEGAEYPWEFLGKIKDFIVALGNTLSEEEYEKREGNVWIAPVSYTHLDDGEKFSGKNLKGQIGEGAGLAAFGVVGMGYIF